MIVPESAEACPRCAAPIPHRNRGDARTSPRAKSMYFLAAFAGGAWAFGVACFPSSFLVPRDGGVDALWPGFYLFPGFLLAMYAGSLPKVRTLSCTGCGWSEVRTLSGSSRP